MPAVVESSREGEACVENQTATFDTGRGIEMACALPMVNGCDQA